MSETMERLADGRVVLRFERRLEHPREKVWAALTERDQLRVWFVEILDYDRSALEFAPGARLEFVARGMPAGRGEVTAWDPPGLLEYTWDGEVLRWELVAEGAGCLLRFTNVVDGPDTARAVESGWRTGLDRLAALLGGGDARR